MHKRSCILTVVLGLIGTLSLAAGGAPPLDIPRLEAITIDGKTDDWRDAGFKVEAMTSADGWVRAASDLDARLTLGWDERGLLVLAEVRDQDFAEAADTNQLFTGDSVELYLVDKRGGKEMIQAVITPGMTATQAELRCRIYDYRKAPALTARAPVVTAARTKMAGGYILEALVPWANVGLSAQPGVEAAVQVFVTDADADARPLTLAWYPGTGTFLKTERTMRIRLAEKAGTSAPGVAHAFELGSNHWFSVITPLRLAGKPVTVSLDGKPVAEGRVSVVHGRAGVCLNAVLPPDRRNVVRYEVAIDGQKLDPIAVADLEQERGESALPMRYQMPEIITSTLLPAGKFEDATAVQHLLGPCDTKVTYYNEMFAKVPAADSTGLYGAVAEIQPRFFQPPLYRFFALARPSGDVPAKSQITDTNFWMHAMRRQAGLATTLKYWLELPQDAGKDPARKWPLFVLLHGAGERGKTPEHFKGWAGYPRGGKPETFIIAVPACPKDTTWSIAQLDDMISDLVARYPVDTDRIYMAGHSMGGNGCWQMLATFPDRFAGGIICAAPKDKMDANLMERFKDVPIWIFHGAKDDAAPVAHARRMASTFESVRGRFRYTENAQDDHGTILDKAFGQTMVYDWLLQQVRGKPSQPQGEKPSGTRKE